MRSWRRSGASSEAGRGSEVKGGRRLAVSSQAGSTGRSQFGGGAGEFAEHRVQGGELEGAVRAPGVHARSLVFGADGHGQVEGSGLVRLQHCAVSRPGSVQEGPGEGGQGVAIAAVSTIVHAKQGDPGGAGVVDGAGPKRAHHLAPVVHGVGKHEGLRIFKKRGSALLEIG